MLFADRLTLDQPRRTADGYLAVRAKAARVGVQDYLGYEVDPEGKHFQPNDVVPVYRPESEVFDEASVRSFLMKPITNDHPSVAVTADNWRDYSKGVVGKALRDGDHLSFDLVLMDAATIADVESGKRQLSNGYSCALTFGDGVTEDGTTYRATQRTIRGNHVAVVDRARAGPECRIGDAAVCSSLPADMLGRLLNDGAPDMTTKTITFDGLPLLVTDAAEAAIGKLQATIATLTTAKDAADAKVGELTVSLQTKDGEIVALKQQIVDATVTPAKLQELAAARAKIIADAKKIAPAIAIADADADSAIKRAAVVARLGDAAKEMADAAIDGAFLALVPVLDADPLAAAIASGVANIGDGAKLVADARAKMIADLKAAHAA